MADLKREDAREMAAHMSIVVIRVVYVLGSGCMHSKSSWTTREATLIYDYANVCAVRSRDDVA